MWALKQRCGSQQLNFENFVNAFSFYDENVQKLERKGPLRNGHRRLTRRKLRWRQPLTKSLLFFENAKKLVRSDDAKRGKKERMASGEKTKSKPNRMTLSIFLRLAPATCFLMRDSYSTTRPKINDLSYGNFDASLDDYGPKNRWCYYVQTPVVTGGGCFI